MCNRCYQAMDKKLLLFQLKYILHQEKYVGWNETSTNFMKLIMADETNVAELREIATKLLEGYQKANSVIFQETL